MTPVPRPGLAATIRRDLGDYPEAVLPSLDGTAHVRLPHGTLPVASHHDWALIRDDALDAVAAQISAQGCDFVSVTRTDTAVHWRTPHHPQTSLLVWDCLTITAAQLTGRVHAALSATITQQLRDEHPDAEILALDLTPAPGLYPLPSSEPLPGQGHITVTIRKARHETQRQMLTGPRDLAP